MRPFLRILDKIIDPLLAVAGFAMFLYFVIDSRGDEWGLLGVVVLAGLFHLVAPLWIAVRTLPRVSKLALNMEFREELAVTPLSAEAVLKRRIRRPMVRSALVMVSALPAWFAMFSDATTGLEEFVVVTLIFVLVAILPSFGVSAICLGAFSAAFRPRPTTGSVLPLCLLAGFLCAAWIAALFVPPWLVADAIHGELAGIVILGVYTLGLLTVWLMKMRSFWRRACERFYTFE